MHARVKRGPFLTAAIGVTALLAAGCSAASSASGSSASGTKVHPASAVSPQRAILLAANNSQKVNTVAATISLKGTTPEGALNVDGSVTEQLHPSLLGEVDFTSFSAGGQSVAGGLAEVITPSAVYMKYAALTQAVNANKSWVEIPLKSLGSTGSALSSLLSEVQNESPITQTELLAHATAVHEVGTAVLNGVPVTEYAGSYSISQALASLPASIRSTIAQDAQTAGITSAQFEVWLDNQNLPREIIITEKGTSISETITEDITSINRPVTIHIPSAAETFVIPSSTLGSLAG